MWVQSHPRLSNLSPIERTYATSYYGLWQSRPYLAQFLGDGDLLTKIASETYLYIILCHRCSGDFLRICCWSWYHLNLDLIGLCRSMCVSPFCVARWDAKLDRSRHSCEDILREFKVIEGHRIWHQSKGICDFPLVVNSNLGRGISCTVAERRQLIGQYSSHITPSLGCDPLRICLWALYCQQLGTLRYQPVKTASSYVHSFWHNTDVCQIDRQTVEKMLSRSIASIGRGNYWFYSAELNVLVKRRLAC